MQQVETVEIEISVGVRAEVSCGGGVEELCGAMHVSADLSQDGLPFLVTMETPAAGANYTEKGTRIIIYKQPQALHQVCVTCLRPTLRNLTTELVHKT